MKDSVFYKEHKGYKIYLMAKNGFESYIGLVSNIFDDPDGAWWMEIVPFAVTDEIEQHIKEKLPTLEKIITVNIPVRKKISDIATIMILDKPDKFLNGTDNKNSEDS